MTVSSLLWRMIRLRCPNCGKGAVLRWTGETRERCSVCNLEFKRGGAPNYFFGAMFFGVMGGELLFALTFGAIVVYSWPNVPWDVLRWVLPIGVIVAAPILIPLAKVVFLSVDAYFRPITPDELQGSA